MLVCLGTVIYFVVGKFVGSDVTGTKTGDLIGLVTTIGGGRATVNLLLGTGTTALVGTNRGT